MKDTIHKAVKLGKRYINRDAWLWNDDVEMKVREKKRLYHKLFDDKTFANWHIYKNPNREAKKAIAVTRADHYKNIHDKLGIRNGERLAKSRNERTQDIEHFCCVNDKNGTLLTNRRAATDRWRAYFKQISTEEFAQIACSKLYTAMREFGIPTKLIRLTRLTLTNMQGQIKAAGSLSRPFDINSGLRQGDALSCVLFNLALEKVFRDADVNARGTILFKSTQLPAYADDIHIMGRTTRDVQTAFIQIEQAAIGARSRAAHQ